MKTKIAYFDETGDDGNNTSSSLDFVLTSVYMYADDWQDNFNIMRTARLSIQAKYNLPINEEMHIMPFLTDKQPYRGYNWATEEKIQILNIYIRAIAQMKFGILNTDASRDNEFGIVIYPK